MHCWVSVSKLYGVSVLHWQSPSHNYPSHACVKGLSNRFCLSFSQSVCPVKSRYKQSYTISKTDGSIDIVKKVTYVYLIGSNCNFCFSSTFLFNVVIIRDFNTVNILDMVESGYSLCTS